MSQLKIGIALLMLALFGVISQAQRSQAQSTAQIGTGSPLPVFVTNTPALPEGFASGSSWRFTTWTVPSTITWVATVNNTSGPWAHLTVRTEDGNTSSRWYYVPAMPGSWEKQ
ncbi:MAG TPA: hypothetical protein VEX68_19600 [Bryobacteraceae bacterium]|nr:hypothetical protein [Bryobacteraceae bacterium]